MAVKGIKNSSETLANFTFLSMITFIIDFIREKASNSQPVPAEKIVSLIKENKRSLKYWPMCNQQYGGEASSEGQSLKFGTMWDLSNIKQSVMLNLGATGNA